MKSKTKNKIVIGRNDIIDLPEFGLQNMKAKIDSGALTSAIHCSRIKLLKRDDIPHISFHITGIHDKKGKIYETSDFKQRKIKSSNGQIELRFIIKTNVLIFGKNIKTEFSLADRSVMRFPILLGRKLLRNRFLIDVSLENLSYKQKLNLQKPQL